MERKKYIQKCYDEYIESTNIETKTIDFSDDVAYRTVSNNLDSFIENSFICFSKSILCGEYIYSDTFNNDITIFLNAISREYSIDDDEKKAIINNRIQEINKSLFNSIRHLQRVQIYAKQKVDTKDNSNDFGIYSTYTSTTPSRLDDFINLCIPICKFDYQFPSNDDKFQDLLSIKTNIENKIRNIVAADKKELLNIYNILLYKCHFIIKRIKKDVFFFSLDFVTRENNPDSLEIDNFKDFFELTKLFDQDKDIEIDENKINKWKKDINSESNNLSSYILLMRHYQTLKDKKDVDKKMDKVISKFDKKYDSAVRRLSESTNLLDKHDKFSWDTVQNFLYNCRFSFLSTHGKLQLKELKEEINKITELHNKTDVRNFHPFEKAIESIIKCLDSHLEKGDYSSLIDDKFSELNSLLKKYEDSIKWSKNHKFFPFQLPFSESLVEINGISVYCPSTFAKYIDYKEQDNYLDESRRKKENLSQRFDFLQENLSQRSDFSKVKQSIENTKSEIESALKRNFEILGIFTGLITFLFGSVNIFVANKGSNFLSIIVNSSALGTVLLLFLALLLIVSPFVTTKKDYKEVFNFHKLRFFAVLFFVLFVLFLSFLLYFKFPLMKTINNSEKQKTDTIYIQKDKPQTEDKQPITINVK